MKYSDLVKKEKSLKITTQSGELNVVYNQTFFNRENSFLNNPKFKEMYDLDFAIYCLTHGLLVSWDLEGENGKSVPISEKELGKLNGDFVIEFYKILQADASNFFKKR